MVILKVVAEPAGADKGGRNREIRAHVGGRVWSRIAYAVRESGRRSCRADVKIIRVCGVRIGQIFAALLLQLVQPGSVQGNFFSPFCVNARRGVVGLRVLAEGNDAETTQAARLVVVD